MILDIYKTRLEISPAFDSYIYNNIFRYYSHNDIIFGNI